MTEIQFVDVKACVSCSKDLEVSYHVPSTIRTNSRHYVALLEAGEAQSEFTWVWAGKTQLLEPEKNGITVKWRKGTVTFVSHVLPKLPDGREYYLIYCNDVGTTLGRSRPFQFFTDSDEFASIELQSVPSDGVVINHVHDKKLSTSSSEVSLHSNGGSMSFEVISEQKYPDTAEGNKEMPQEPQYLNQPSVISTVTPKDVIKPEDSRTVESPLKRSDTKSDDELLGSTCAGVERYQNAPDNQELVQLLKSEIATLKEENGMLKDEVVIKDNIIEELNIDNSTLKEQIATKSLSQSTVVINSPKEEDKEKKILRKRVQDETKKSSRLEELLHYKQTQMEPLQHEIKGLKAELNKVAETCRILMEEKVALEEQLQLQIQVINTEKRTLIEQVQQLQSEQQKNVSSATGSVNKNITPGTTEDSTVNINITTGVIGDVNIPVSAEYKTKLFIKLFKQEPFICHICNQVLPAHTQEFTRLNHVQHCKGYNPHLD